MPGRHARPLMGAQLMWPSTVADVRMICVHLPGKPTIASRPQQSVLGHQVCRARLRALYEKNIVRLQRVSRLSSPRILRASCRSLTLHQRTWGVYIVGCLGLALLSIRAWQSCLGQNRVQQQAKQVGSPGTDLVKKESRSHQHLDKMPPLTPTG